jgi:hypothetical protein
LLPNGDVSGTSTACQDVSVDVLNESTDIFAVTEIIGREKSALQRKSFEIKK